MNIISKPYQLCINGESESGFIVEPDNGQYNSDYSVARRLNFKFKDHVQILESCGAKLSRFAGDQYIFNTREQADAAVIALRLILCTNQ